MISNVKARILIKALEQDSFELKRTSGSHRVYSRGLKWNMRLQIWLLSDFFIVTEDFMGCAFLIALNGK